jgi:hypothetical protein
MRQSYSAGLCLPYYSWCVINSVGFTYFDMTFHQIWYIVCEFLNYWNLIPDQNLILFNTGLSHQMAHFYFHFCQYPINYVAHLQYTTKFPNIIFLNDSVCVLFRDILFSAFVLQLDTSSQWILTYSVWNSASVACHSWNGLMSWKSPFLSCQLEFQKNIVTLIDVEMQDADGYTIICQKFLNRQFRIDRTIVMVMKPLTCVPLLMSVYLHILP